MSGNCSGSHSWKLLLLGAGAGVLFFSSAVLLALYVLAGAHGEF